MAEENPPAPNQIAAAIWLGREIEKEGTEDLSNDLDTYIEALNTLAVAAEAALPHLKGQAANDLKAAIVEARDS